MLREFYRTRTQVSGVRRAREGCLSGWWARQGSNLHGLLHRILSPARLPIPPRAHKQRGEPTAKGGCGESFNWAGATGSRVESVGIVKGNFEKDIVRFIQ